MEKESFKHKIPIQLRTDDLDRFGHINNAVYFTFYDLAKTNYIESICPNVNWEKEAIVVADIHVSFKAQIFGTDSIGVKTAVTSIGSKSFELVQHVIDTKTEEVKCECRSIMVTYDLLEHKSKPIPQSWIDSICLYEGRDLRRNQQKSPL